MIPIEFPSPLTFAEVDVLSAGPFVVLKPLPKYLKYVILLEVLHDCKRVFPEATEDETERTKHMLFFIFNELKFLEFSRGIILFQFIKSSPEIYTMAIVVKSEAAFKKTRLLLSANLRFVDGASIGDGRQGCP
jgi:hypothetical protein